jgi:hypothetical protein
LNKDVLEIKDVEIHIKKKKKEEEEDIYQIIIIVEVHFCMAD